MSQGGVLWAQPKNHRLRDAVLARSVMPAGPHTVDLVFGPRLFGFLKLGDEILLEPRSLGYWTRFEPGPLDLAAELGLAGADVVEHEGAAFPFDSIKFDQDEQTSGPQGLMDRGQDPFVILEVMIHVTEEGQVNGARG